MTASEILLHVVILTLAATAADPEAKPKPELDALLGAYRAYGLPLPPEGAKLIRFENGVWTYNPGGKDIPHHSLGFVLKEGTKDNPPVILVGTQEGRPELRDPKIRVVEPKASLAKEVDAEWRNSVFELNAGLATACQCKARGWNELAEALLAASLKQESGHPYGAFRQPANLPPRMALAYMAWAHWANELIKKDTDRAAIAKRMRALLADEPTLASRPNRALLRSLEAALAPQKAKPGSLEGLIDDLVDLAWDPQHGADRLGEAHYWRLVDQGFAAVPALIEHLDDDRLTRTVKTGFNNFPTFHLRVGDLAGDLLQGLAGEDLGKNWLRRQQGYTVEKADALAWWKKAREIGEESYLLSHVLPRGEKEEWPSQYMLHILARKYTKRLPEVYRTLLDQRPEMQSWPVAEAVATSTLSRAQKLELFLHAAANKRLEHQRVALRHLNDVDHDEFVKLLIENLESMPVTPKEPYSICREAAIAHLILLTDDARAWLTLTEVAKRSDVGMRMQLLNSVIDTQIERRTRKRCLAFLATFLGDSAVRDEDSNARMFEGLYAGFTFPRLAVRDFAAMQIAWILKIDVEPEPEWTKKQWSKLRERVREALKRELPSR
jgi:hypothetical protein